MSGWRPDSARTGHGVRLIGNSQGKEGAQPRLWLGRRYEASTRGGLARGVLTLRRRGRKGSVAPLLHQAEQLVQRGGGARFDESDERGEDDPEHRVCQLGRADARQRTGGVKRTLGSCQLNIITSIGWQGNVSVVQKKFLAT